MSELPPGWVWAELSQLLSEERPLCYGVVQPGDDGDGEIPLVRVCDLENGTVLLDQMRTITKDVDNTYSRSRLLGGEILISLVGTIGRIAVAPSDLRGANIARALARASIQPPLEAKWVAAWLSGPEMQHRLLMDAREVAQKTLNLGQLRVVPVPVPPVAEQRRIVTQIETLTTKSRRAKEALNAIPALLERFRKSVLAAAFRGDLTADWREKNPDVEPAEELLKRIRTERRRRWEEAELAKMRAKGKVPGDDRWKERYEDPNPAIIDDLHEEWFAARHEQRWGVTPLEAACDPTRGIPYGIVLTGDPDAAGVPTVRCGDIKSFKIDISALKRVARKVADEFARTRLEGDEVLIAIRGTVGATAVATDTMKGMNISREIAMIPLLPGIEPRFVMYLLASPGGQAFLSRHIKGVAQAGINLSDLRAFPLPLPSLDEQREIVSKIEALLQRIDTLARTLDEACLRHSSLDRAILAKAFRGELVPQDPNDEPASLLLERLRVESAENGTTSNGTNRRRKAATPELREAVAKATKLAANPRNRASRSARR
ncbi:restriction endonuclease subunit S [Sorangium cellulosum]|uniref:restriction endonuclease subunit S n=1 Tax=Sorangium cellulosum TaxID=56 RepID=UPI0004063193|nr:restriction endonuclease subunit S [Sorangium cellulosum]